MSFRPSSRVKTALISASALSLLVSSGAAFAADASIKTPAGTKISSTATATYVIGGGAGEPETAPGRVSSNEIVIRVDELIDLAAKELYEVPIAKSETALISWFLTNTGNGSEEFNLKIDLGNNTFTPNKSSLTIEEVVFDENQNGVYDPGVDRAFAGTGSSKTFVTPSLAPDRGIRVIAKIKHVVDATATDADWKNKTAEVKMTATAVTGSGTPGTVFSGAGDMQTDAVIGLKGGTVSSVNLITVTDIASASDIALQKTYAVKNQFGGIQAIPGATITYTIQTRILKGTARNFSITDPIPTNTVYVDGSLKYGTLALVPNTTQNVAGLGDISSQVAPDRITVNLGNITSTSEPQPITFQVKVK